MVTSAGPRWTSWAGITVASIVTAAVLAPVTVALASSGPPPGRVHDLPEPEPASPPTDGGAPASDGGRAEGSPRDAAPDVSAIAVPTQSGRPVPPDRAPASPAPSPPPPTLEPAQVKMPTIQRPEQPITSTPIPGQVYPATPAPVDRPLELEYVPGYRYILSGHKENYFISGVTQAQHLVKFQYSVKFDLWPNASRHSAYFAFTQKSLWDLYRSSAPFLESNYAPEVFYGYYTRIGDLIPRRRAVTPFIDYARVGLEHESNGLDTTESRSWNRLSGTVRTGAYLGTNHYVTVAPKAWLPMGISDNPDIAQFLGYGSLTVEYGYDPAVTQWYGGGDVRVTALKGANLDWSRRGIEVAAQWRPGYEGALLEWWKFTPYFFAQFFTGYGETLLRYNEKFTAFRIGVALEDRVNWVTLPKRR
jgi:outer membrane phospholipase A